MPLYVRWLGLLLLAMCTCCGVVSAATPAKQVKQEIFKPKRWALTMAARMALSDDPQLPHGAGLGVDLLLHPVERMGVGVFSTWSNHQGTHFLRGAVGVHFLLDILPILPFFQTSVGFQGRFGVVGMLWTADVHFGGGVDVPLPFGGRVGVTYNIYVPLQIESFPITKSLHLRLTLVF
ncbi:MAG TPA: hypothetical protein DCE42_23490 [Myxococcales bacterium]|nr:hypothetical protein [Deltaproteobacteria bacterium]HAA57751.1 hypothetical protein [Myxococcales bacterium]